VCWVVVCIALVCLAVVCFSVAPHGPHAAWNGCVSYVFGLDKGHSAQYAAMNRTGCQVCNFSMTGFAITWPTRWHVWHMHHMTTFCMMVKTCCASLSFAGRVFIAYWGRFKRDVGRLGRV
jgi:hypothetical protein